MFLVSLSLPFCIDNIWFMYLQYEFQFIYLLNEKQNTRSPLSFTLSLSVCLSSGPPGTQSNWQQSAGIWQGIKLAELSFSWKGKPKKIKIKKKQLAIPVARYEKG